MESQGELDIVTFIALGTIVLIILVVFIIIFVFKYHRRILLEENKLQEQRLLHQQQMIIASLLAEENERSRLSKNVHDEVGTYASLLNMNLSRIENRISDHPDTTELISEQKQLIKSVSALIRNVSRELASPIVNDFGLVAGIEEFIKTVEQISDIKFSLQSNIDHQRFDKNIEVQLYRTIKEIINNLIKHAAPSSVNFDFKMSENIINLRIRHNGNGMNQTQFKEYSETGGGNGLRSMEARIHSINGTLNFEQTADGLYLIAMKIPLDYERLN